MNTLYRNKPANNLTVYLSKKKIEKNGKRHIASAVDYIGLLANKRVVVLSLCCRHGAATAVCNRGNKQEIRKRRLRRRQEEELTQHNTMMETRKRLFAKGTRRSDHHHHVVQFIPHL
jgi:hypothetical protein